jgi:hypothetical protein
LKFVFWVVTELKETKKRGMTLPFFDEGGEALKPFLLVTERGINCAKM